ncbi:DUF6882 domain-containing protein [Chryseobacterium chendengshani]|uniref:DUF6882 domain-containing protein n=1 Tax=Chryseobacterium sp. LJ756 TaxID=2864113 RepID=UPI001C63D80E|nr:DUF6882 domain-containing protein [Chryseobacterium sp. LJ756]MBW7674217.1 hypothetical protein [Chryseobacterium sp. LJ756]
MDYEEFADEKCQSLMQIQEEFREKFGIDRYELWHYDAELELLRLYNDDQDQLFLKYIPIGTFSLKSETWMWSWYNEYAAEPSKENVLVIKDFGIKNDYHKLVEGTFSADEFDCWEFAAICFDKLDGIGVYRLTTEKLHSYLLVNKILEDDAVEVIKYRQQKVNCEAHGYSRAAFVCQHLNLEQYKGFEEAFDTYRGMQLDEDDDFQAWCSECEKVRLQSDGWNNESEEFAKIKLICEDCYFELKSFNSK